VLTTAPAGLADQFPKDMRRLGRLIAGLVRRPAPAAVAAGEPAPAAPGKGGGAA
jgi:hypothetical protein